MPCMHAFTTHRMRIQDVFSTPAAWHWAGAVQGDFTLDDIRAVHRPLSDPSVSE